MKLRSNIIWSQKKLVSIENIKSQAPEHVGRLDFAAKGNIYSSGKVQQMILQSEVICMKQNLFIAQYRHSPQAYLDTTIRGTLLTTVFQKLFIIVKIQQHRWKEEAQIY